MHKKPLTKEDVQKKWQKTGYTARQWAKDNNYKYDDVIRVMNGISKARFGNGHKIAVALGMKIEEAA